MALSTPRQPASRGLDDPGLGAVFPQPRTGATYRITPRPLVADSAQRQPCCWPQQVQSQTTRCAPWGETVPVTAGGLKNPKLRCAIVEDEEGKSLSPLGCSQKAEPFVRAPATRPTAPALQLVLPKQLLQLRLMDERIRRYSASTAGNGCPNKTLESVTESSSAGLSQPPNTFFPHPLGAAVLRGIEKGGPVLRV